MENAIENAMKNEKQITLQAKFSTNQFLIGQILMIMRKIM